MATTKVDPAATYVVTAKGAAAIAVAQAVLAGAVDQTATHSNLRKLCVMAAACGTNGATGAALLAACNAAGDKLYAGHAIGRNGYFAAKPAK